jgi:hypothetical protein
LPVRAPKAMQDALFARRVVLVLRSQTIPSVPFLKE